jgi:hypothetical protein
VSKQQRLKSREEREKAKAAERPFKAKLRSELKGHRVGAVVSAITIRPRQ